MAWQDFFLKMFRSNAEISICSIVSVRGVIVYPTPFNCLFICHTFPHSLHSLSTVLLTGEAELPGCWALLQCGIDPRTSGKLDCAGKAGYL